MRWGLVILIGLTIILFQNCKKETEDYSYCTECTVEEWKGKYSGNGTYFKSSSGKTTEDVEVSITINITSADNLSVNVFSQNIFSQVFYGSKEDGYHYFQVAGSSKSLDLSLYKKGAEYKITGTAKTYKTPTAGSNIDESLTFRVFKESD